MPGREPVLEHCSVRVTSKVTVSLQVIVLGLLLVQGIDKRSGTTAGHGIGIVKTGN